MSNNRSWAETQADAVADAIDHPLPGLGTIDYVRTAIHNTIKECAQQVRRSRAVEDLLRPREDAPTSDDRPHRCSGNPRENLLHEQILTRVRDGQPELVVEHCEDDPSEDLYFLKPEVVAIRFCPFCGVDLLPSA